MIELSTAGDAAEVEFILDSDTYDSTAGYFENKMLWVSAFNVNAGTHSTIEYLDFDDILVWFGQTTDDDLTLDGEQATDMPMTNVETKFGVKFLPIRNTFTVKNTAGSTDVSKVTLWGLYTKRNG